MNTKFTVGNKEKHDVEFSYDKIWGTVQFKVDGNIQQKERMMFAFQTVIPYRCLIGETEKHTVTVEIQRPQFLGGFIYGWKYSVLVDGQLIKIERD